MSTVSDILKKPQFTRSTPLDEFFKKFDSQVLSKKGDLKNDNTNLVTLLLNHFQELHDLVIDEQVRLQTENSNMLPISLHDMRYVEELIQLIVAHGIMANIPPSLQPASQKSKDIPRSHNLSTLKLVVEKISNILVKEMKPNDYIRSIVLKGPLYTYTYLGILTLCTEEPNKAHYEEVLRQMENVQQTYELFAMYNFLVQELGNAVAKAKILSLLSTLAVRRENGVLSLIDFVVGAREDEQLDIEKMNRVTQIIVAKPKTINSVEYFSRLFPQIFDGLSMVNRPIVVNCLNSVVTALFFKNSRIINDFLFRRIYQVIFNEPLQEHSAKELNDVVNVIISLTKNSSNELISALVQSVDKRQFYLNLWIYVLFLKKYQKINPLGKQHGPYYEVILTILKTFVCLFKDSEALIYLSMNLLNYQHEQWGYQIDFETQLAYITLRDNLPDLNLKQEKGDNPLTKANELFAGIDESIDLFIQLLKMVNNENMVKDVFLAVLNRWVKTEQHNDNSLKEVESNALVLLDLKALEKLHREFSTDILKKPQDILKLIDELIDFTSSEPLMQQDSDDEDSDDEEEREAQQPDSLSLIIQILESVLSMPPKQLADAKPLLQSIDNKLQKRGNSALHKDLLRMLEYKPGQTSPDASNDANDYEALEEALNNLNDSLAPMQVLGLTQLNKLVQKHSKVISAARATQLHLQYLKNQDPYVYLNAIKGLSSLCQYDKTCIDTLVDCYSSIRKLDDALKIGEVFIQYIQQENQLFQGIQANKIIDACITNVRRRGEIDDRLRMSAMSILGISAQVNARGIQDRIGDMLDCSFGVLQMETKTKSGFVVRRAALHLIHDLMYNSDENAGVSLFPPQYDSSRLKTLLDYTREKDDDQLVSEQAAQLLSLLSIS
ncbi:hypothetical protein ZYGR_0P03220 [Zygosaccharomyces rouxii]|uniref:RNA polymerase II assembly factor Rtp1 C-terminal domain-containing protein n=1 Tax=Zygosaccharomyces rouxii TaxID=4956 RepID=A0A1Q3A1V9_ZYGRO|nr:hypothetical protein ZYGR_0P03220 [Zygosaccharomyces rouxii]